MKKGIRKFSRLFLRIFYPLLYRIENDEAAIGLLTKNISGSNISIKARVSTPAQISDSKIGDYTYISGRSNVTLATIGKFCSIGPNFLCGFGIHPTNGISTSPAFYSLGGQCGTTFSKINKIKENLPVFIGNDVFIGMNVTILDGVTIGDGAVIGAGAVVSKNIPPYAVAVGSPIRIIKYRFDEDIIEELLNIKWWDFDETRLKEVEKDFFTPDEFIKKFRSNV